MCRWLAYAGPELLIERLLFAPSNSLIQQSLSAQQSIVPTNGDGFGLGWYGDQSLPGLFRDTLPAWNDANLRSISEQIRSRLFFAHVRASTGTSTSRENCHPFRHEDTLLSLLLGRYWMRLCWKLASGLHLMPIRGKIVG
jgi:glutamine amidotransferase